MSPGWGRGGCGDICGALGASGITHHPMTQCQLPLGLLTQLWALPSILGLGHSLAAAHLLDWFILKTPSMTFHMLSMLAFWLEEEFGEIQNLCSHPDSTAQQCLKLKSACGEASA